MSNWIRTYDANDIDDEDVVPFTGPDGNEYAVYRSEDDEFFVSAGHCTHEKQKLCDGLVMDGVIECPKHNGRFNFRTGKAMGAPVIVDLKMFDVKVEEGFVYIDVDS